MRIAFLFAGQGSQKVGMGKDFYDEFSLYQETIDELPNSEEIKEISFYGSAEKLSQTRYTQPCMVAFAIGVTQLFFSKGLVPDAVAGLSLGEYSALAAAGVLTSREAVSFVEFRAKSMEEAGKGIDSSMVAILGASESVVKKACEKSENYGVVEIANINCPGQIVISGEKLAIEHAVLFLQENGIKKCIPIDVSGSFHTRLMKPAGDALRAKSEEYSFKEMNMPVIFNYTGAVITADQTIPQLLEKQVQNPVLFQKTIECLGMMGIDTIVEIGPGKALSGFVRRTNRDIQCLSVEDVKSFKSVISKLKGGEE